MMLSSASISTSCHSLLSELLVTMIPKRTERVTKNDLPLSLGQGTQQGYQVEI